MGTQTTAPKTLKRNLKMNNTISRLKDIANAPGEIKDEVVFF